MNVFLCDHDPKVAAQSLADQHVVKMPLEGTQILCTLATTLGIRPAEPWYKPTHRSHPCTLGVGRDPEYRRWVVLHVDGLFDEYEHRFGREHASRPVFERVSDALEIPRIGPAPEVQDSWPACPRVDPSLVQSYRTVLARKYATWPDARWRRRTPPVWLGPGLTRGPGALTWGPA